MSGFDWTGLMRLGMRGLGLRPHEFWALTPAELTLLLGRDGGQGPLSRARLDDLARAFPDLVQSDTQTDTQRDNQGD